jgi:hypothetical protein
MVDLRSRARPPGALHRELHKIAFLAVETPRRLRLYSTMHVMIAWAANTAQRREIAQANVGFPADRDVHRRDPQRRLNVDSSRAVSAHSGQTERDSDDNIYRPRLRNLQRQSRAVCQARAPCMNEDVWLAVVGIPLPKAPFLDHVIAEADDHASAWASSLRALSGT